MARPRKLRRGPETGYAERVKRHRSFAVVAVVVAGMAGCAGGANRPRQSLTPRQMVESSKPAIVRIEVSDRGARGLGTGFVVGADGRIATNLHVIQGVAEAVVVLHDGTRFPVEEVVAVDQQRDLVIVRIGRKGLPTLVIGNSDHVSAGDPVYAIGNPLGADYTISDGLISAVRRLGESLVVLQISAPISQGSSGGPLLNHFGEVIGVATWVSEAGQNLNFGMPSNYLLPLVAEQRGISFREFVGRTSRRTPGLDIRREPGPSGRPRIVRQVPRHEVAYLEGCTDEQLERVGAEIAAAIEKGAPLYNQGDHEACFRIYEGVALRLEHEVSPGCGGPRDALGQGLLRSGTLETYTEKAWAMRDAFDGLLDVMRRRAGP
jgi:serine protease Do